MASLKEEDEMVQEAALNELTELMSMSSEEALTVLPLEELVPQLVRVGNCHFCNAFYDHSNISRNTQDLPRSVSLLAGIINEHFEWSRSCSRDTVPCNALCKCRFPF